MTKKKVNSRLGKPKQPKPLKGKGDYTQEDRELLKRIDKKLPEISAGGIGRSLGNLFGRGDMGETLGKGVGSLFGFGDYAVKTNSLMPNAENLSASQVPLFSKDGRRGVRVIEREYICDVIGSASFVNQQFVLDPIDANTFPWLSRIAKQFEQWEPNGIVFQFVSTSSEFNGVGQALGTVVMATDYDIYDPAPASKVQMENYDYAQSTKPSESAVHGIECDPKERPTPILYLGAVGPDLRFSQMGTFNIATTGMTSTPVVGELWVSYDITLYKKQLGDNLDVSVQVYSQSVSAGGPLLGTGLIRDRSSPGFTVTTDGSGSTVKFPRYIKGGTYQLVYTLDTTTDSTIAPTYVNFTVFNTHKAYVSGTLIWEANGWIPDPDMQSSVKFGLATGSGLNPVLTITATPQGFS